VGAVRLALPALLLLFFVVRSFRQRVFLLGIPFLMYMGSSVFFEKTRVFSVPARLSPADHLMIWLVVVWVLSFDLALPAERRDEPRTRLFGPRLAGTEEAAVIAFTALTALELVLTLLRFGAVGDALGAAKPYLYLFAGYFLLRGILCRADRRDTLDFIKALVVVNTIAAGLFILHQGLHLPVYEATEYQVVSFMGQRLTRSFYFMPQLFALTLAYVYAKPKWSPFWVGVLVVSLGALWISYTRSLLLIAVAELVAVLGVRLLKQRQAGLVVRRAAGLLAVVLVVGAVVISLLPVQSGYVLSRFSQASSSGGLVSDPNMQNRERKLSTTLAWIGGGSRLLGEGLVSAAEDPHAADVEWMSADLVWVPVLFRFGLLGVAVVAAVYVSAAWRATRLALSGAGEAELMALILLGLVVGLFLEGFVSWTFLNSSRYPLGLWFLALLAAEAHRRRAGATEGGLDD